MVQFFSGVAGRRGRNPSGVVIHNDAASQGATVQYYKNWLPSHDAALGFAHWYVCSDGDLQVEDEANMAWHTANANGNSNFIGIEACQSMGNEATFRNNEQHSIKLAAQILKRYGLSANRNTVILHKQFSSTACPHRSVSLHGDGTVMQDYFISEINKVLNGKPSESTSKPTTNKNKGVATMYALYEHDGKWYFYNGVTYEYVGHPDALVIIKEVYRKNNGKEIPEFHWKKGAPWWSRLEQPVVDLQKLSDTVAKIAKKVGV